MKITSRHMTTNGELILKVMLSGCKLFCSQSWTYDNHYDLDDCSAIIIDIDNTEGKQLWRTLDLPGIPLVKIAYTSIPENRPCDSYFITKPIRFRELNKVIESLNPSVEKSLNETTFSENHQKIKNEFTTVLEIILNYNKNNIVQLNSEAETVIIDNKKLIFSGSISDEKMEFLLLKKFSSCEIEILENDINPGDLTRDFSGPLSKVISQEFNRKLFPGLNEQDHFKLIRWPNFKKNRYNSAYVKIAVALSNKFYDIPSVLKLCKVSFEDVVSFINICHALNNLDIQTIKQPVIMKSSGTKRRKEAAFLAKIRSRFGI
jgi:hypothetical protein